MKNWKTSLFGSLASIGALLVGIAAPNSILSKIGIAASAIGGLGTGLSAKDKDVTGAGTLARRVGD